MRLGPAILALTAILFVSAPSTVRADFTEATSSVGLLSSLPTWGAQAVDMDADGDVDLLRNLHFYRTQVHTNDGNGRFRLNGIDQIAESAGDRHGFLWADLDADGLLDVVCSHGGNGGCGCSDDGNEMWRSLGNGRFERIAGGGGLEDHVGRGRAFSAADVDGDGDLDLLHGKAPLAGSPNSLYRNDGGFSFTDIAAAAGLAEVRGTVGALFADWDDDGDADVFLGGEEFRRPSILYRNDGAAFTDVTASAFARPLPIVSGADWGDFDNDGDLDLAVCEGHEGIFDAWGEDGNELWFFMHHRFGDDGVDVLVFDTVGGANPTMRVQSAGADRNDLVFLGPDRVHPTRTTSGGTSGGGIGEGSIEGGTREIQLNDSYVGLPRIRAGVDHGIFVWRILEGGPWVVLVSAPPATFGNFSGVISSTTGFVNPEGVELEEISLSPMGARVFRNDDGHFTEVTGSLGLASGVNPRAVKWVDFDNDGDLDLHQMNKGTSWTGNEPDILWRNDGETFTALTGRDWVPGRASHLTDGGVWADFDRDGDLDLFLEEGAPPAFWGARAPSVYYRNRGPNGHWLEVTVSPSLFGATPVGTKVTAHAGGLAVHRRVEANAWRGFQGPAVVRFGLGEATVVDSLVLVSQGGARQVVGPLDSDQAILVTADAGVVSAVDQSGVRGLPGEMLVYPQPARGDQFLRITHAPVSRVSVTVFDVTGRRVRTLARGPHDGGELRMVWDGRDDAGRRLPSGVYFVRGEGDLSFQRKVVRVR